VKVGRKGEHPAEAHLRLATQAIWRAIALTLELRGLTEPEARQVVRYMKREVRRSRKP